MRWLYLPFLAGCGFAGAESVAPPSEDRSIPSPDATRVEVVALESSVARLELSLPGEVQGSRDALLSAGNGGLVEAVLVHEGERVRRGQSLLRVDAEIFGAQLDQSEAQHAQAAAALERVRKLGDLAAGTQLLEVETAEKVAAANVRQAKARYARAIVTAPFDGVVADLAVEVGESAGPGSPVARLVQLDPALVTLSVSDRDVVSLRPGTPVKVSTAARSEELEGTIVHVAPAADLRTRSFPVDIEVANPDELLLPGMIARVAIDRDLATDVKLIPQDWLVTRREERGVFVEEDGFAVWRPVELGAIVHDQVVVTAGLDLGARIVVTGQRGLMPGDALLVAREGTCCAAGRPVFGD